MNLNINSGIVDYFSELLEERKEGRKEKKEGRQARKKEGRQEGRNEKILQSRTVLWDQDSHGRQYNFTTRCFESHC